MPEISVINPNSSSGARTLRVSLDSIVPLGEFGDHKYVFSIYTLYKDKDDKNIKPVYVHTTAINGFWEALPKAISSICDQMDWGSIQVDTEKPYVNYYGPTGDEVSLFSSIVVGVKDDYPSAGIDTSSIKMYINDIDVTADMSIDGTYKDIKLVWNPNKRILK
jgi:hypothetical protein